MKNIKKTLLIFVLAFMVFIPGVSAKESFRRVWYTPREKILKEFDVEKEILKLSIQNNVYEYNEGYVTSRIDLSVVPLGLEESLTIYDYDGKKLENKVYKNKIFLAVKNYKEYLYALTIDLNLDDGSSERNLMNEKKRIRFKFQNC